MGNFYSTKIPLGQNQTKLATYYDEILDKYFEETFYIFIRKLLHPPSKTCVHGIGKKISWFSIMLLRNLG